jgi:hypothetical protein
MASAIAEVGAVPELVHTDQPAAHLRVEGSTAPRAMHRLATFEGIEGSDTGVAPFLGTRARPPASANNFAL